MRDFGSVQGLGFRGCSLGLGFTHSGFRGCMYGRLVKYHGPSLSPQYSSAWIMYSWHPIRTTPTFDNARVDFRVQP